MVKFAAVASEKNGWGTAAKSSYCCSAHQAATYTNTTVLTLPWGATMHYLSSPLIVLLCHDIQVFPTKTTRGSKG